MSLAQQRFLEGFITKCASYGVTDGALALALLEKAAKDALKGVEEAYKKQGKSPSSYDRNSEALHGVHSYDEGKSERYPTRS